MKQRIFIPATIVLIIIVLLGFFIGCTVNDDPSSPGGKQDYVGTWVYEDAAEFEKIVYIFTVDTFVRVFYELIIKDVDTWEIVVAEKGTLSVEDNLMAFVKKEISIDGTTWFPLEPLTYSFNYSIYAGNQMMFSFGGVDFGYYLKQ